MMKKLDQDDMKRQNRSTVFQIIKQHQPISRAAIAKQTGMSPTTVSRIIAEFSDEGYVVEMEEQASAGRGRKSTLIRLREHSVLSVGVQIDREFGMLGIVDVQGNVMTSTSFAREPGEAAETTARRIGGKLTELVEASGLDRCRLVGLGIGVPGIVNVEDGTVRLSVQLGWREVGLAGMITETTGLPVVVDNELKLKGLAEQLRGAAQGSSRTVLLGFGHGVGSALIRRGEIYRGATNSAGEIAHMMMNPQGMMCDCGNVGCLQTFITIPSLLSEARKMEPIDTFGELFEQWQSGKRWASFLLEQALVYMAMTVNNVVSMYNPDRVIVSGEMIDPYPEIYEALVDLCRTKYIWEPLRGTFSISRSDLARHGVLIGSGLVAQNVYFQLN
ncbi:ROK family transcriptional regulator [Paenibacillus campinasensis]|nr:ROK family protein [Paenibacillus campinasensis]